MFDNKEKKKNQVMKIQDSETTVISQGIFIEGHIFKGVGTVRLEGVYIGEIFVDGQIVVGKTGEIRGNVTCSTLVVAGTIIGNIVCKEEAHFTETSLIEGDIQTASIIIDQGASIIGNLNTRKKSLNEPINLDEAVKSISGPKRASGDLGADGRIGFS